MPVQAPTLDQMRGIARDLRLHLSDADLDSFRRFMQGMLETYRRLDQLVEPSLPVRYPRTSGYRPSPRENPLNAWYRKCSVKGAPTGPLAGKRVALKDNICLAGVPMMNGSALLEGYVPEFDATLVTRILDAGGEIVGKAVCEHLCVCGGSFTSDTGPVLNPHDLSRSTGGSSSGCAALVVSGECDMAIGGDQGGSIRLPAAWCGAYGLKPTYGLVPYTGIFPSEMTLDHAGPMATTVADVALLLEVIAGADPLDPRQKDVRVGDYTRALVGDAVGLRVGILEEGFGWPGVSEPDVEEAVLSAAHRFEELGAKISRVSVPMHRDGFHIWAAIATGGKMGLLVDGNGIGSNWKGYYPVSMSDAFARGRLTRADDLSEPAKLMLMMSQYLKDNYHGRYYAKAQNLARSLTEAYDEALRSVDILVLPTVPKKAALLPPINASRDEILPWMTGLTVDSCQFDVTGHPSISVPCGLAEGLPVGMMLVGRRWEDATILRAAHAFEQTGIYTVRPPAMLERVRGRASEDRVYAF